MQILDGKTLSEKIFSDLKSIIATSNLKITLDIVIVGDDLASLKYVEMKQKKAEYIGIKGNIHHLPSTSTTSDVIQKITQLNSDSQVTAFMVQLPLPKHIDTLKVLNSIDPKKDADGLTASNLGLLLQKDQNAIASATPLGIMTLLESYKINIAGKNVVVLGRSPMIGLPLFALLQNANSTVTLCHSHTQNLASICSQADILISAIGQANYITPDFVKDQAVIVDVGTNFVNGKLVGDVDFTNVSPKCSYITPVPGGVGPMTIASLLKNTYNIFINLNNL